MSKADELITQAVLKVQNSGKRTKIAEDPKSNEQLIGKQEFSADKVINAVNSAGSLDEKLKAYTSASGYKAKPDTDKA